MREGEAGREAEGEAEREAEGEAEEEGVAGLPADAAGEGEGGEGGEDGIVE
ncbi:hypothetical protein [Streptomyces sp. NPDC048411]|uniref:hypothetical protein n=1 Tax=Streptomyces sp. NPDC048411 TaxID=3157206 RepID=UPI0034552A79